MIKSTNMKIFQLKPNIPENRLQKSIIAKVEEFLQRDDIIIESMDTCPYSEDQVVYTFLYKLKSSKKD